jgi:hypothetical protein
MPKTLPLSLIAVCVCAGTAFAQSQTATLSGRVADPSGGGVAAAHIRLTDRATSAFRDDSTLPDGAYRFDLLPPGDYSIRVTAPGFKAVEDSRIHLDVATSATFDVALSLGAVADSVEVTAEVSPVVAVSVADGTIVSEEKIQALPLNGRQFLQLALLSPGTNSGGSRFSRTPCARGKSPV